MDFVERFRAALRIRSFWPPGAAPGDEVVEAVLTDFQEFLVESFPAFHKIAERHVLGPYSMLYRWPGLSGAQNNAVMLLAHYDVVPVEKEKWSGDPFGAEMKDGYIYGRGSLDMKSTLISIMEAAEKLCIEGFRPGQDIWFALGGDEERAGVLGAKNAAGWLNRRGQRFSWVLDEGTPVAENQIKGLNEPLALVSIEEKGFLSLDLTVNQEPGHASRPPKTQAAAVLGRALCRIAARPFPYRLTGTAESFFKQAASFIGGAEGFILRHSRLFGPLFFRVASANPAIAPMLRTTVAMTQLEGSAADNVLPSEVRAVINLRLLSPWTVETAIAFIKKAVNDERVKISIHGLGTGPVAPASDYLSSGWPVIKAALAEAWPGVPMLPFLMTATTDSRHYKELAGTVFRFSPHKLAPSATSGVHGHDEKISLENLSRGLEFYTALFRNV